MVVEHQFPLGARFEKDRRSRGFFAEVPPGQMIKPVAWPYLGYYYTDQGNVGACVGFTGLEWENTWPNKPPRKTFPNTRGFQNYAGACRFDQWDDNDYDLETGVPDEGTSLLGLCKYFMKEGRIERYEWAFGIDHYLLAMQKGPLASALMWTEGMSSPDPDGRARPTGREVGGHAVLGYRLEWHIDHWRIWFRNHWTKGWGKNGRFYMTKDDWDDRLRNGGEAVRMIRSAA